MYSLMSGCTAQSTNIEGVENASAAFEQRQREELISFMSLETLFPDPLIRELASAAGRGRLTEIEEVVNSGIDVNSQGSQGATPLFWTLRRSNIDGYRKLLELGADPNLIFAGGSVMHWAANHSDIRFLELALHHGGNPNLRAGRIGETPLLETIGVDGNLEAMRLLLDYGADIDMATSGDENSIASMGGITPLLAAAALVRFDLVIELLERGADYTLVEDNGMGLVDYIDSYKGRFSPTSQQLNSYQEVVSYLRERGVTID